MRRASRFDSTIASSSADIAPSASVVLARRRAAASGSRSTRDAEQADRASR